MKDNRCFCDTCQEEKRYAFSPHPTKDGRICSGHPRIVNPDPDEGETWAEVEAKKETV